MPTESLHTLELTIEEANLLVQALANSATALSLRFDGRSFERREQLNEARAAVNSVATAMAAFNQPEPGEVQLSDTQLTVALEAAMVEIGRIPGAGKGSEDVDQRLATLVTVRSKVQRAMQGIRGMPRESDGTPIAGNPSSGSRQQDVTPGA